MKTKVKIIGLLCVECGDRVAAEYVNNGTDGCWLGYVRHFCCIPCRRSYILLFTEQRAFVSVLIGPYPWVDMRLAGMIQYNRDVDETPF